ncbi:hypothetical protein Tco_0830916 [Tanacetum coccineum]
MFGIGDDRVPGPSAFFKKSWAIVGTGICNAVREFFNNGQLLKEINHTFIALIPKVSTSLKVNDYRPISCCNVLYKCISKILTKRIIDGIKEVVSENQFAFIPGKRISDNILLTQELIHNYHRNRGPPRCAFKVDIQKAYDNVDWNFLENILKYFGFHNMMIKWIMACVTSASFSISTNGDIHGELLVKYLEVPLISSRILNRDCKVLVEKVSNRIGDWKNKSLSFADIEQLMWGFLWCNGELKQGKAKDIPVKADMSWGWRKILQIREYVKPFFWSKLGNGMSKRELGVPSEGWLWPQSWLLKAPNIGLMQIPRLEPMAHMRNAKSVMGRLLVAAASYFIWKERNNRVFKNVRRSPEELRDSIIVTIRLKLLTFRFKNNAMVKELLARWKMPINFRLYG